MADYNKDQSERKQEWPKSVKLGKEEESWIAVDIELPDEDIIKIAQEAHRRDITINKMVNIILKDGIKNAEYRFEHEYKPQLLSEDT
jgi:hypothetical protein